MHSQSERASNPARKRGNMKYLMLLLLLLPSAYSAADSKTKQTKLKIYTLEQYRQAHSKELKKYVEKDQDFYWGITNRDLAPLTSEMLNLKLSVDYYMKSTIAVDEYESNDSLKSLLEDEYFFNRNGIRENYSSPSEAVFYKNRALVTYYGTDGGGIWSTIKLIVKSKKQFDIYSMHEWAGDVMPVEPASKIETKKEIDKEHIKIKDIQLKKAGKDSMFSMNICNKHSEDVYFYKTFIPAPDRNVIWTFEVFQDGKKIQYKGMRAKIKMSKFPEGYVAIKPTKCLPIKVKLNKYFDFDQNKEIQLKYFGSLKCPSCPKKNIDIDFAINLLPE